MKKANSIDILEESILEYDEHLLDILLSDKTTGKNIIWATDNYAKYGTGYQPTDQILPELITGQNTQVIQPRITKSKEEQLHRTKDKAEVFTPSWICNAQNNEVDKAWFGRNVVFNKANGETWAATKWRVDFPKELGKTWQDYVTAQRLEITCGEAPYLVSRYDTTTGQRLSLRQRIGLLDRKMRIVNENCETYEDWYHWTLEAYKSVYGFEYQGDSVLIARENLLLTFADYVMHKAKREPHLDEFLEVAEIIAWNIWQMDGLKFVVPLSCISIPCETKEMEYLGIPIEFNVFDSINETKLVECPGCSQKNQYKHTGVYSIIMDWKEQKEIRFVDFMKGDKK